MSKDWKYDLAAVEGVVIGSLVLTLFHCGIGIVVFTAVALLAVWVFYGRRAHRGLREQIQREKAEAQEEREEAQTETDKIEAVRSIAKWQSHVAAIFGTAIWHMGGGSETHGANSSNHVLAILRRNVASEAINPTLTGYRLEGGKIVTRDIPVEKYPDWVSCPMIVTAEWEEHELDLEDPTGDNPVKPEFVLRSGTFLFDRVNSIHHRVPWDTVGWDDEDGVALRDNNGNKIIIPVSIEGVLNFVTTFKSAEDAYISELARWAPPAIFHSRGDSPEAAKARIMILLGVNVLDGYYPFTQERWDDLINRDPWKH